MATHQTIVAQRQKESPTDAPPIAARDMRRHFKARPALRSNERVLLHYPIDLPLGVRDLPKLFLSKRGSNGTSHEYADLQVAVAKFGERRFMPDIPATRLSAETNGRHRQEAGIPGQVPVHLPFDPFPKIGRATKTAVRPRKNEYLATTVFGADDRDVLNNTSYPWSTVGRVETSNGFASGVMIGPRHLLTVSHVIKWNSDGTAGYVKFTPAAFGDSKPFGAAYATRTYYAKKVYGPSLDRDEMQHDYVCCVLDWRMGDVTGWMGSRSWSDDWDDKPYWFHVGYPGDVAGGTKPTLQSSIKLDGSYWDREVHTRIFHKGDVFKGQSGGPFFAWWEGETFPRVVGVQSAQNSSENTASGGAHMVNRVIQARAEYP
ncbi:MAG: hypothetical protein HYT80_03355 [Euryarchaeota archaeon]|nr:hypothetical protein [Euryarchaeota archaeon]